MPKIFCSCTTCKWHGKKTNYSEKDTLKPLFTCNRPIVRIDSSFDSDGNIRAIDSNISRCRHFEEKGE